MNAQRPQETLKQLCEICPLFADAWAEEGAPLEDGLQDGVYYRWSHHAVMRSFLGYFAANHESLTKKQLGLIGEWMNAAVATQNSLENAVATCFLEHARQAKINRVLAPYLSPQAKKF